ncbi:MAG: Gfo/Idh/MocA family oxidoreductase [Dictyoglomaceae bacterium]|nr:Gfo/Idh/MocA family oxidoreductase [Dictyoglomaceae bacterium]
MRKIKVGVVGVGYLGQHHVRIFSELLHVELVGIADINEVRVREMASLYQVPFYTKDYRDLLDKVEAVSIVTPTSTHFKIAKEFLEKGVHIFVEKPVTQTLEEAEKLVELASGKDLVFQVGHIERFNPAVQELKKYIKNPFYLEIHRMGTFDGRSEDIGVVMNLMIHDLDILFYILGKERKIKDIQATGYSLYTSYEDFAHVNILFENGMTASLTASRLSSKKLRKLEIHEIDGTFISVDYIDQSITITHGSKRAFEPNIETPVLEREEPLRLELEHFVNCILNGGSPLVTLEDGKLAIYLASEILKEMKVYNLKNASLYK